MQVLISTSVSYTHTLRSPIASELSSPKMEPSHATQPLQSRNGREEEEAEAMDPVMLKYMEIVKQRREQQEKQPQVVTVCLLLQIPLSLSLSLNMYLCPLFLCT